MSLSDIRRRMKNLTMRTMIQSKVREATDNEVTFPTNKQLMEISCMTYSPLYVDRIMKIVWTRLNDHVKKNWRRVLKGLILLEHLLKYGSVKVVEMCNENIYLICMLQTYLYAESSVDCGILIRDKADTIYKLLQEPELLAKERELAAEKRNVVKKKLMREERQKSLTGSPSEAPRGVPKADSLHGDSQFGQRRTPFAASSSLDHSMLYSHDSAEKLDVSPLVNNNQYPGKTITAGCAIIENH